MIQVWRFLLAFAVWTLLLIWPDRVVAIVPEYAPVSAHWLREHRFPMERVGHFKTARIPDHLPIGSGIARTTSTSDGSGGFAVTIHGVAKDGTKWEVVISGGCCTGSFDLYLADLDNNGQKDAIITFRIATTGLELEFEHLMLLFDANGLPTPYLTVGCCLDESDKMLDFVDLDNDGRAEVFDQDMHDDKWRFGIYRADNTRWQRISRWPALEIVPMALRNRPCGTMEQLPWLDTTRVVARGRLLRVSENESRPSVVFAKATGATGTVRLRYDTDLHCVMVVDTPSCRRILFGNAHDDEWTRTLSELASGSTHFYGLGELGVPSWLDEPNRTAPMIAWFRSGFSDGDRHGLRR